MLGSYITVYKRMNEQSYVAAVLEVSIQKVFNL